MAYVDLLKNSAYMQYFPDQLIEHLHGEELKDASVAYKLPEIIDQRTKYKQKKLFHHPIQEIRSWCNIMIGIQKFCRMQVLSGHSAIEELYKGLTSKAPSKLSMHQKEINLAIKLLVLAARDDDYSYGMKYCHKILANGLRSNKSIIRTLKIYRLLSYLFDQIQLSMQRGKICIRSLLSIANEVEIRERRKYKYIQQKVDQIIVSQDSTMLDAIISDSIDQLFAGLETFATTIVEQQSDPNESDPFRTTLGPSALSFDLDIENHVDNMIAKLGLTPSGPYGYIDLGDDVYPEDDDW